MVYVRIYPTLPEEACWLRETVFVEEQGFTDEFDKLDISSTHFVLFVQDHPAAVCRVYWDDAMGQYILGRVAVSREFRRQGLGGAIVRAAEDHVQELGGQSLHLHAQCRITDFYEAIGYAQYGEVEDDQGCPHIWMMKKLLPNPGKPGENSN